MSEGAITREEFDEAIEEVIASGDNLSQRNVRRALGDRGSMSTINRWLRDHRKAQQQIAIDMGTIRGPALPDSIAQGLIAGAERYWAELGEIYEDMVAQIERQHAQAMREQKEKARAARDAAQAAAAARKAAEAESEQLRKRLEHLEAAHRTLEEAHHARGVALELAEERKAGAERLAEERRDTMERDAAARARAERALERASAEHEEILRSLRGTLAERETTLEERAAALARAKEQLKRAQATARQHATSVVDLNRVLEDERAQRAATHSELNTYRERCAGLADALAKTETQVQGLMDALQRRSAREAEAESEHEAAEQRLYVARGAETHQR